MLRTFKNVHVPGTCIKPERRDQHTCSHRAFGFQTNHWGVTWRSCSEDRIHYLYVWSERRILGDEATFCFPKSPALSRTTIESTPFLRSYSSSWLLVVPTKIIQTSFTCRVVHLSLWCTSIRLHLSTGTPFLLALTRRWRECRPPRGSQLSADT